MTPQKEIKGVQVGKPSRPSNGTITPNPLAWLHGIQITLHSHPTMCRCSVMVIPHSLAYASPNRSVRMSCRKTWWYVRAHNLSGSKYGPETWLLKIPAHTLIDHHSWNALSHTMWGSVHAQWCSLHMFTFSYKLRWLDLFSSPQVFFLSSIYFLVLCKATEIIPVLQLLSFVLMFHHLLVFYVSFSPCFFHV